MCCAFCGKTGEWKEKRLRVIASLPFLRGRRRGGGFSLRPLAVYAVELLRPAKSNKLCNIKFCFNFILKDQARISCLEVGQRSKLSQGINFIFAALAPSTTSYVLPLPPHRSRGKGEKNEFTPSLFLVPLPLFSPSWVTNYSISLPIIPKGERRKKMPWLWRLPLFLPAQHSDTRDSLSLPLLFPEKKEKIFGRAGKRGISPG